MVTQAPGNGGGGNDRDVIFRLGIGRHPDTKKNLDELNRQVGGVQRTITQKAQDSAREQVKAAKQAAQEQIEQFQKVQNAAKEFAKTTRELNERFVSETKGAAQGLITLGKGFATLGLVGEENTQKLLKGLVAIQGAADTAFGSLEALVQGAKSLNTFRDLAAHRRGGASGGGGGGLGGAIAAGGAEALAGEALRRTAGKGLLKSAGSRIAGLAGSRVGFGSAAAIGGTALAAVGAGAAGISIGRGIKNPLTEALSQLSEATGATAQQLSLLGGATGATIGKLGGITAAADGLITARKRLKESEEAAARDLAEARRKEVEDITRKRLVEAGAQQLTGQFAARNQLAGVSEAIKARQQSGGDAIQEQLLRNQFGGQRALNQFKALGQLAGGSGAEAEAARQLRGSAAGNVVSAATQRIGLLGSADAARNSILADAERSAASEISRLQKTKGTPEEIAAAQSRIKQVQLDIADKRQIEVRLDQDQEELLRQLENTVLKFSRIQNAELERKLNERLANQRRDISQENHEQLTARKTQF